MQSLPERWRAVQGGLIVSCQSSDGDAFHGEGLMARFAAAALGAGAVGLRLHGAGDIASVRAFSQAPIIGIHKELASDGKILITPTLERASELVRAGADAVALDGTSRGCRFGALDRLRRIKAELGVPAMADIATLEEAEAAVAAGADFVLPTMRGYTAETSHISSFEPLFVRDLCSRLAVPVIAEGRIGTPRQARAALDAGAYAVVVGSAITRPQEITRDFVRATKPAPLRWAGAIDLGATAAKWGVVSSTGDIAVSGQAATPAQSGREELLAFVGRMAQECLQAARALHLDLDGFGVATAGWVDRETGKVAYATGNLPGWAGASLRDAVARETGLPVVVENDAVAAAAGELLFGAGRQYATFLCVTLGTGVGAGAVVDGRLLRGAHGLANMLGHIPVRPGGLPCTCGMAGCLEAYAGARGRERLNLPEFADVLADGLAVAVQLLDPQAIILSGGFAAGNEAIASLTQERLQTRVLAYAHRRLVVRLSAMGRLTGVAGAAALSIGSAS